MKNDSDIDSKSFAGETPALPVKGFEIFGNRWTASLACMRGWLLNLP
jgi:hypothetical protein